jgi:tetratricopeptide (TPR) repeat protein
MSKRKPKRIEPTGPEDRQSDNSPNQADQEGGKILVPVFTAVILLLIAAAVAVIMSPDKPSPATPSAIRSGLDARPALPEKPAEAAKPQTSEETIPLDKLVLLLEKELAHKDRSLGQWRKGRRRDPRNSPYLSAAPVPGRMALAYAKRIPDEAPAYASALKAIAEGRFAQARKTLDDLIADQDENPVLSSEEEARLYAAKGDAEYFDHRFAAAVKSYTIAAAIAPKNPYIKFSLAKALLRTPPPAEQGRIIQAIQLLTELESGPFSKEDAPLEWGLVKIAQGTGFWNLTSGDPALNRKRAIAAHRASLEVFNRQDYPIEWARIQDVLGEVYSTLPEGERSANLAQAMKHFRQAAEVITKEDFPQQWSSLQAKLGDAYGDLPSGDRKTNLEAAIQCYERALTGCDAESSPAAWASIQMGLGTAYGNLEGDRLANLSKSTECYQQALKVLTREDSPVDWATLQNNLANNYISLAGLPGVSDREGHLERALACLGKALQVLTNAENPVEWASAQYNTGAALRLRQSGDRLADLRGAIRCFDLALKIFTPEQFPEYNKALQQIRGQTQEELDALAGE